MGLVLDTSTLIDVEKGKEEIINKILNYVSGKNVFITSFTLSEFWLGIFKKNQKNAEEKLDEYKLLNTTKESSIIYAKIKLSLSKKGKIIPEFDMLIASIVIANDLTLVTKDKHFENIPNLKKIILS